MKKLLGLSGLAGAGKDATADILVRDHGFVKVSLADPMKRICADVFDWDEERLWGPSEKRNEPDVRYRRPGPPTFPCSVLGAAWVPLSRGHALVSVEDFDRVVAAGPWCLVEKEAGKKTAYAKATIAGVETKLHHFIFGSIVQIDHVNGDGLDNRRSNLRETNASLNHANMRVRDGGTSQFKGVSFDSARRKWSAKIGVRGRTINIGRFDSEAAAAMAYDKAARAEFGAHARTNDTVFLTARYALQLLGTEFGRACYEDMWVRLAIRTANSLLGHDGNPNRPRYFRMSGLSYLCPNETGGAEGVVISDVRFGNELAAIEKAGGVVWRITRPGAGLTGAAAAHVSETELTDDMFELKDIVVNDGTLVDLAAQIAFMLRRDGLDDRRDGLDDQNHPDRGGAFWE